MSQTPTKLDNPGDFEARLWSSPLISEPQQKGLLQASGCSQCGDARALGLAAWMPEGVVVAHRDPGYEGGVDVDGARVAVSDEAEVVGAAGGGRYPAVLHARPQVEP